MVFFLLNKGYPEKKICSISCETWKDIVAALYDHVALMRDTCVLHRYYDLTVASRRRINIHYIDINIIHICSIFIYYVKRITVSRFFPHNPHPPLHFSEHSMQNGGIRCHGKKIKLLIFQSGNRNRTHSSLVYSQTLYNCVTTACISFI